MNLNGFGFYINQNHKEKPLNKDLEQVRSKEVDPFFRRRNCDRDLAPASPNPDPNSSHLHEFSLAKQILFIQTQNKISKLTCNN